MRRCILCGVEIVPGVNGCTMYDTCTSCKPIRYPTPYSRRPQIYGHFYGQGFVNVNCPDYEDMILAQQERQYDD